MKLSDPKRVERTHRDDNMQRRWLAIVLLVIVGCSERETNVSSRSRSVGGSGGGGEPSVDLSPIAGSGGLDLTVPPGDTEAPLGDKSITQGAVPDAVDALFAAAEPETGAGPALAYPTPGVMFPPNIARILFQWQAPSGSAFQLHFETPTGKLDVYTDGVHATCSAASANAKCWESDAKSLMPYLKGSAGSRITLTLRALEPGNPGKVWESTPYQLFVARSPVTGAIYYWSTTAQGVRRGTLDGRDAADFLTPPLAHDTCVACHTVSRSGKRMMISFPGDLLGVADVVETVPPPVTYGPPPFNGGRLAASWATFSPDDSKLVVSGQGSLTVVNAADATPVGAGLIPLPSGVYGTMPDWAPDGKHLAFASVQSGEKARHLQASSIAWLSADGDSFRNYELIAESKRKSCGELTEAYANPMFSPDSKWLAFSHADCSSEGDPTAEVVLARAEPNAEQLRLELANTQVGDAKLDHLQNGMPTWAPALDGNIAWIAFTSTRKYGLVLNGDANSGSGMRQLWVAAVDLSKVGQGDPSFPAFRLPAQDLTENNHRPFWAIDVLPPDWKPPVVK